MGAVIALAEAGAGEFESRSNLPDAVRFSTNGLVLDGGLVVLSHPSHGQALWVRASGTRRNWVWMETSEEVRESLSR